MKIVGSANIIRKKHAHANIISSLFFVGDCLDMWTIQNEIKIKKQLTDFIR